VTSDATSAGAADDDDDDDEDNDDVWGVGGRLARSQALYIAPYTDTWL
jgi:hypothetical protein